MSICEARRPAPLRCPNWPEILDATLKLLPRGRAWQTHEIGPREPSWQYRFWKSVAQVYEFVNHRLCALRLEFWCATHSETHDFWMAEYGLPDGCDPFPNLCAKVAAIGGTRCEYYTDIAARAGWSVKCIDHDVHCGGVAGCAKAGRTVPGSGVLTGAWLKLLVDIDHSSAYNGPRLITQAGRMKAGRPLACPPSIAPLECILARVVHAEISITYGILVS